MIRSQIRSMIRSQLTTMVNPDKFPNSWLRGFNNPVKCNGVIYCNQIIGCS